MMKHRQSRGESPQGTEITMEEALNRMDARWQHPQAKHGSRWEGPLSFIGLGAFAFLAVMFFLSQLGILG